MSMSKKDFIALADAIKGQIEIENSYPGLVQRPFTFGQIQHLADFCQSANPAFKRDRWLDYIAGKCGKNGGVK